MREPDRLMRAAAAWCLTFTAVSGPNMAWSQSGAAADSSAEPASVSLVQLIASPGQYDGRRVAVAGFCTLEFEGAALYMHREDYLHNLRTNAVRLVPAEPVAAQDRAAHLKYVSVEGTFFAPRLNSPGYRGVIRDIRRIEVVASREGDAKATKAK